MVVAYVTDSEGESTVVWHIMQPNKDSENNGIYFFRLQQQWMESVLHTLVEPVQQLHWLQELLP